MLGEFSYNLEQTTANRHETESSLMLFWHYLPIVFNFILVILIWYFEQLINSTPDDCRAAYLIFWNSVVHDYKECYTQLEKSHPMMTDFKLDLNQVTELISLVGRLDMML